MYQLKTFGLKKINGGDILEFDENSLRVLDNGSVTRKYTWNDFKCAKFSSTHVMLQYIKIYHLHFNDGTKVMIRTDENPGVFGKLQTLVPNNTIRNAPYKHIITLLVIGGLLLFFAKFLGG